jgi:hypothetical protein
MVIAAMGTAALRVTSSSRTGTADKGGAATRKEAIRTAEIGAAASTGRHQKQGGAVLKRMQKIPDSK